MVDTRRLSYQGMLDSWIMRPAVAASADRGDSPRAPWTPPTAEERELSRKAAELSLKRSHLAVATWLARPCHSHNAKPGEFCIEFVRGLCGERIGATDE